jgi:hypothetical protein
VSTFDEQLWGTSVSVIIAIAGAFPAVAAWVHSGVLPEEQELICGGEYKVVDTVAGAQGVRTVRFEYLRPIEPLTSRSGK